MKSVGGIRSCVTLALALAVAGLGLAGCSKVELDSASVSGGPGTPLSVDEVMEAISVSKADFVTADQVRVSLGELNDLGPTTVTAAYHLSELLGGYEVTESVFSDSSTNVVIVEVDTQAHEPVSYGFDDAELWMSVADRWTISRDSLIGLQREQSVPSGDSIDPTVADKLVVESLSQARRSVGSSSLVAGGLSLSPSRVLELFFDPEDLEPDRLDVLGQILFDGGVQVTLVAADENAPIVVVVLDHDLRVTSLKLGQDEEPADYRMGLVVEIEQGLDGRDLSVPSDEMLADAHDWFTFLGIDRACLPSEIVTFEDFENWELSIWDLGDECGPQSKIGMFVRQIGLSAKEQFDEVTAAVSE